jgi:sn-glycerol 3-phosphate transport system substrate-binding protein
VHTLKWARPGKDHSSDFVNGLSAAGMMSTGSMGGIKANARFDFGTAFLPKEANFGCCTGGAGFSVIKAAPADRQAAVFKYIAFGSNPENTAFWSQSTGYMPVRKSAVEDEGMKAYFDEFPQFRTAVDQLPLTSPQDSARVFVPNGDQIIGKGLERITVEDNDVAEAFADVQEILEREAEPVIAAVKALEG